MRNQEKPDMMCSTPRRQSGLRYGVRAPKRPHWSTQGFPGHVQFLCIADVCAGTHRLWHVRGGIIHPNSRSNFGSFHPAGFQKLEIKEEPHGQPDASNQASTTDPPHQPNYEAHTAHQGTLLAGNNCKWRTLRPLMGSKPTCTAPIGSPRHYDRPTEVGPSNQLIIPARISTPSQVSEVHRDHHRSNTSWKINLTYSPSSMNDTSKPHRHMHGWTRQIVPLVYDIKPCTTSWQGIPQRLLPTEASNTIILSIIHSKDFRNVTLWRKSGKWSRPAPQRPRTGSTSMSRPSTIPPPSMQPDRSLPINKSEMSLH